MLLCAKCHRSEATIHFTRQVGQEKVDAHLCEDCARPVLARLEASRQGRQPCEVCGGPAFNPLPTACETIYACCGCRAEYARAFFELCATQRPDLLDRSKRDIHFFDLCFDAGIEAWVAEASAEAVRQLRNTRDQSSTQ